MSTLRANAIQTVAGKPILNSTGSILQVVQATYTNNTSFATGTTQLITGLSASITPSSSSNKILILFTVNMGATNNQPGIIIYRNGSALTASTGDGGGSRSRVTTAGAVTGNAYITPCSNSFLDSPATTSATTYALYLTNNSGGTAYVNQSASDTDGAGYLRPASFMQLMEVSA